MNSLFFEIKSLRDLFQHNFIDMRVVVFPTTMSTMNDPPKLFLVFIPKLVKNWKQYKKELF